MPRIHPLRDLARIIALKSNPYWPFSSANRACYHAAAAVFARAFSGDREVSAIYVRHTMASGDWTPGSSDIDLSVILRPDIEPEREFAFLRSFWARFARLQRFWPMLGEVDLLNEHELPVWLHYSARSARPAPWRLLGGREVAAAQAAAPPPRWRTLALKTAYWFYMDRFLPALDSGDGFLAVSDRQRLARKILRLAADTAGTAAPPAAELERESAPLLVRVLRALSAATIEPPGIPSPAEDVRPGPELPMSVKGVISVVCDHGGRAYVVVQDGLDSGELIAIRDACRELRAPVFLTAAMFRFLVREYEPQQYGYFDRARTIAFGVDPLPSCAPPTREQVAGSLLDRIPNALLFPRRSELFEAANPVLTAGLAGALRQFLPILMVQSGDFAEEELRHVLPVCRVFGAREFGRLEQFSGAVARWEAFMMFRELAARILQGAR